MSESTERQDAMARPDAAAPRRSPWPYAIIGALVAVVGIQTIMLTIASRNAPVLESSSAYEDSKAYDAVLEAWRASAALGWSVRVETDTAGVTFTLTDADGAPVRGLTGVLELKRPDTRAADAEQAFAETAPGVYRAGRPAQGGVFRLAARLEGGPAPWIDDRRVVLP